MSLVFNRLAPYTKPVVRSKCTSKKTYKCNLLVVGGGTGGCSVAWRFARRMKKNCLIMLEPSQIHYYQPAFTLVAAGIKKMKQSHRPLSEILPRSVTWLQDSAEEFDPCKNLVLTRNGDKIYYEFMVVAVGIKNDYDKKPGYHNRRRQYLATYNTRSLRTDEKIEELEEELSRLRWDTERLSEVRRARQDTMILKSGNLLYFLEGEQSLGGVGLVVHKSLVNNVVKIESVSTRVIGLQEALENPQSTVSTIYSPVYCTKTWSIIQQFNGGHALFTFPVIGGKCSGAAMKIMFLAHDYWRRNGTIEKTSITYNTGAESLFGVPKYALALRTFTLSRQIVPNYCADLVEVTPRSAVFMGSKGETISFPYKMLHVTPPMSPPLCLAMCKALTNEAGYLYVDQHTLQHVRFANVFGLGDCTCTPNSKTAAAVAPQSYVVERNLTDAMAGKILSAQYNGYGACPLITSYKRGILAEFLYEKTVWETLPFDQSKESRIIFQINKRLLPYLYWNSLLKGRWNGPGTLRIIINPFRL